MARLVESAAVRVGFTGGLGTRNERPGFKRVFNSVGDDLLVSVAI